MNTPDDDAPSLGGDRAAPDPEPDAASADAPAPESPDPESPEADGTWRVGFRFDVGVTLNKGFTWRWGTRSDGRS